MKVLHVVDSLKIGGSESLVATLVESFKHRGVDNVVCGLGDNGPLADRLTKVGCPSVYLGKSLGVLPGVMARLGWIMLRESCDVVICHHYRQLFHALPASVLLRKKLIHVEHDSHSYRAQAGLVDRLAKLSRFIDRIVFVSDEINQWFSMNMPARSKKFSVITNGVDTAKFAPDEAAGADMRQRLGLGQEDVVFGTCARLETVKDLPLLIRSFAELVNGDDSTNSKFRLVIAGDGSLRDELKTLAGELGVAERCHFTGVIDYVSKLLSSIDVYMITSENEGLPLSVLEAMSTGLPVVSTDVGTLDTVVSKSTGVLLKGRGTGECAAAMRLLGNNEELRNELGNSARSFVESNYSVESMVDAYLDLIQGK